MKHTASRRVAWTGMLFALCIVLSYVEAMVAPMMQLAPGIKLGLANIVVMYALMFISAREGMILVVLKSMFVLLTKGAVTAAVSFSGGVLSFLVMLCLLKFAKPTNMILSVSGAIAHNIGQLAMVSLLLGSGFAMAYLPVLLLSGLVVGALNSILLGLVANRVPSLQRQKQNKEE